MPPVKRPMPPPPPPLWVVVVVRLAWTVGVGVPLAALLLHAGSLVLEAEPAVAVDGAVEVADVERALALVRANDPRFVPQGVALSVVATQRDVDLLLAHAARRQRGVRGRVVLREGAAEVTASVAQPVGRWVRWLNVRARVREGAPLPRLEGLRVGVLPVPVGVAQQLAPALLARLSLPPSLPVMVEAVTGVSIAPNRLQVRYRWTPEGVSRLMNTLVAPEELARLRDYHGRLLALLAARDSARSPVAGDSAAPPPPARPLVALLRPLLAAAQRGGDAAAEVRAALLTLALYVANRPLGTLVPAAASWPALPRQAVVLGGREDLAAHFLVSALVVVEGSSPLAQAVGLFKEVQDSRTGGSGFSFADLAADLAGTRFGEVAQRNPAWLAGRMAEGLEEGEILPVLTGMPEGVDSATFTTVYGGVEGAATRQLRGELARRLDTLALYR